MPTAQTQLDRARAISWYKRNRARSAALFDVLTPEAYYAQPITLRHPIVFYEGHLPAFSLNTVVKRALGLPGVDDRLEQLFARGIDPDAPAESPAAAWPNRAAVRAFAAEADRLVLDVLANADLERPGHPLLDRSEAVYAILEHEAMHQETLLYMWHRLPLDQKTKPANYSVTMEAPDGSGSRAGESEMVDVPAGRATLGVARDAVRFAWDNERPAFAVDVPGFRIERHAVSNGRFLDFVEAGGYTDPQWWTAEDWAWIRDARVEHPSFWERRDGEWHWLGMFERLPLPAQWPVFVSHAEARAYARWRGRRLPTEAEFQRAAYGAPDGLERTHPWGDAEPDATRGVFDFSSWEPQPVGTHPAGQSAWGIHDLVGNGWTWTSTLFAPFPGFTPMPSYPEYSADFFDEAHYVMKGASHATARELLRPSFRNWFRPRYPYVYATFRTAEDA